MCPQQFVRFTTPSTIRIIMAAAAKAAEGGSGEGKQWLPLESNPDLMNKYCTKLGAQMGPYEFTDVLGVDEGLLAMVPRPVLAVLLLFPISEASERHRAEEAKQRQAVSDKVYFVEQTVGNACGTIGLIHTLANVADKISFEKGKFFADFLDKTAKLSPSERAKVLQESPALEQSHQEIAQDPEAKSHVEDPNNVNLHFNCFVCIDGVLYELDGRKTGPVNHGACDPAEVLERAVAVIKQFMQRDPKELRFSMVALAPKAGDED